MNVVSEVVETNAYKRNKRKMASRGMKIEKLNRVVENLMHYSTEGLSNLHPITKGKYAGNMDGHIGGDWILLYHYSGDKLILTLTDTGDHQMLFDESFDDLLFHYDDNPPTTIEDLFNLDYLYHGTYLPYLEEIKKSGYIKPGIHKNWDISEKFVYLTKDPDDAYSWAETAEDVPEEYLDQIVVLKIDPKYLDINKLDIDHNQAYSYDGDIDPDYPETWVQFEYNGEIPIKAIKEIIKE